MNIFLKSFFILLSFIGLFPRNNDGVPYSSVDTGEDYITEDYYLLRSNKEWMNPLFLTAAIAENGTILDSQVEKTLWIVTHYDDYFRNNTVGDDLVTMQVATGTKYYLCLKNNTDSIFTTQLKESRDSSCYWIFSQNTLGRGNLIKSQLKPTHCLRNSEVPNGPRYPITFKTNVDNCNKEPIQGWIPFIDY